MGLILSNSKDELHNLIKLKLKYLLIVATVTESKKVDVYYLELRISKILTSYKTTLQVSTFKDCRVMEN
jgi:hypothetical protein